MFFFILLLISRNILVLLSYCHFAFHWFLVWTTWLSDWFKNLSTHLISQLTFLMHIQICIVESSWQIVLCVCMICSAPWQWDLNTKVCWSSDKNQRWNWNNKLIYAFCSFTFTIFFILFWNMNIFIHFMLFLSLGPQLLVMLFQHYWSGWVTVYCV